MFSVHNSSQEKNIAFYSVRVSQGDIPKSLKISLIFVFGLLVYKFSNRAPLYRRFGNMSKSFGLNCHCHFGSIHHDIFELNLLYRALQSSRLTAFYGVWDFLKSWSLVTAAFKLFLTCIYVVFYTKSWVRRFEKIS